MIFLGSPTNPSYSITALGVSCKDSGMTELNDESECESAAPKIQLLVPNARYSGLIPQEISSNHPPGCFFHNGSTWVVLYWNNNKNGTCSECKSVCKGSMIK